MNHIQLLIENVDPKLVWTSEPADGHVISACEEMLGVKFPQSYRDFLSSFGALSVGDSSISGILNNSVDDIGGGSVVGDTQRLRQEYGLPVNLVVIESDDEAPYCLDVAQPTLDGECYVVCYELHNAHSSVVAKSFTAWVAPFVFGKTGNG